MRNCKRWSIYTRLTTACKGHPAGWNPVSEPGSAHFPYTTSDKQTFCWLSIQQADTVGAYHASWAWSLLQLWLQHWGIPPTPSLVSCCPRQPLHMTPSVISHLVQCPCTELKLQQTGPSSDEPNPWGMWCPPWRRTSVLLFSVTFS